MSRYIDADKLINNEYLKWGCDPAYYGDEAKESAYLIQSLETAPTVDDKEVVKGYWLEIDSSFWNAKRYTDHPVLRKTYQCANCYRKTAIKEKFCPNCGADMRG